MRFVQEHQRVGRQVVDQRRRRIAGARAGQMARIVLDALAEAELGQHLEVEARALLQPLRLDQLVFLVEEVEPLAQLGLDRLDRAQHGVARRHVVARRIDREARNLLPHLAGQRIEILQRLDLVVEQFDAHRHLGVFRREDIDGVAAHAEGAALEVGVVAGVLHRDQPRDHVALADAVAGPQSQNHLMVFVRVADTIDRRHRRHDNRVAPLQQALGRRQPHLLDMLVDRRVLFDEQIALRNVGFRLVIVVIADEILDRIARKEFAEFRVKLGGQRLVRGKDDGRPAHSGDHIGHREGLARASDAEQRLIGQAILDALDQLADGFRLIAGRRIGLIQLEWRAGEADEFVLIQGGSGIRDGHGEIRHRRGENLWNTGGYARISGLRGPFQGGPTARPQRSPSILRLPVLLHS